MNILNNPDKKREMIDAGSEYVKKFADDLVSKQIMNVYKQVLKHA